MFINRSICCNTAFAKYTPTAFIVDSPFQLLCAVEAIHALAIEDYLMVLPVQGNSRCEQMLQMVNDEHLSYQLLPSFDTDQLLRDLFCTKGVFDSELSKYYERVVIGDFYAIDQWAMCYLYAKQNASVFFLDDGNISIDLLQGRKVKGEPFYWYLKYKWYRTDYLPCMALREKIKNKWKEKNIQYNDCIFTLFYDIDKNYFLRFPNEFNYFNKRIQSVESDNSIYIVGTSASAFTNDMRISVRQYEGIVWQKLSEIRDVYPESTIVYIPHGRDDNKAVRLFCNTLQIQYQHLDCAIEYYFIKERIYPQEIYGFGSTALYSLKKIMPRVSVINWFIDNPNAPSSVSYKNIALYYQKHGIITDRIPFPPLPFRKRITRIIKMLLSEYRGHKNK